MPGPSGYTTAFIRPDPLDPNDAQRQRTQSRSSDYPYDQPVSYGAPVGTDHGGAAYQIGTRDAAPVPRKLRASAMRPKDPWELASEMVEYRLSPYTPGDQSDDSFKHGYGQHGRMGECDAPDQAADVDMDGLRSDFRSMFSGPSVSLPLSSLLTLLAGDPAGDGGEVDSDDILSPPRDGHVFAPGAEDDPETL